MTSHIQRVRDAFDRIDDEPLGKVGKFLDRMTDDAQRALNDYNHIRATLDGMVMVCGRTGNAFEDFEEQAAAYQKETGRMRPGKDRPMTSDDRDDDREVAQKNFSAWVQSKIQAGRDAISGDVT